LDELDILLDIWNPATMRVSGRKRAKCHHYVSPGERALPIKRKKERKKKRKSIHIERYLYIYIY
jgi:hypothetical protein